MKIQQIINDIQNGKDHGTDLTELFLEAKKHVVGVSVCASVPSLQLSAAVLGCQCLCQCQCQCQCRVSVHCSVSVSVVMIAV